MLVKLNIFVPEELRTTIKIEAAKLSVTMQQYVIMAVEWMAKEQK